MVDPKEEILGPALSQYKGSRPLKYLAFTSNDLHNDFAQSEDLKTHRCFMPYSPRSQGRDKLSQDAK